MSERTDHGLPPEGGGETGQPLGLAGTLAKSFIHSPLSPLLLLACLFLGIMGLILTPRQEDPQISVPMVDVFFSYPGASAEQVASIATDPLERLMSEIQGVDHVYSRSDRHGGMVTVQFEVGEDMGASLVKLNDKIQSNLDKIPPGVSMPLIRPKGVDDVPVVTLTIWSHSVDEAAMRTLALDIMQRLKEVPDTAQSFIVGGRSEAIKVEIFPERLAGFGIGLDQLAQTIRTANAERGVGQMEEGDHSFTLYTGKFLRTARDIENLMVGVSEGAPVYVRDIALVSDGTDDATSIVGYFTGPAYGHEGGAGHAAGTTDARAPYGAPAVTIAVAKKQGSNGVTVANSVLDYVERLQGSLIPDNVNVEVTRNYGKTANEKVNELIFKLFVATGAVTILIWLALGYRAALVVAIVIPVVILMTVFSAWVLGYTIDRVSLFALIFSIGILVDDAIVVVENIYRRWLMQGECTESCSIDAVREVGNPTVLATLTVIAALLPMGFVRGMMGPYMQPIPALGSVAMVFSLFAAFIFTPWLAQFFRPPMKALERAHKREERQMHLLQRFYARFLVPLIQNRFLGWLFGLGLLAIFVLSLMLFATTAVTVKMLPKDNKPEFNVTVNMPEGTALPVTANVVAQLAARLRTLPEVTALQAYVGTASPFNFNGLVRHTYLRNQPWMADIQVQLVDKHARERSSEELAVAARELLTGLAHDLGARIEVVEMPPGPPVLQTMVADIYGPDARTRRQVAADIEKMFERSEIIVDVDSYLEAPHEAWQFVVDREKASRRGVSVETINRQLDMAMGGFKLGDVKTARSLEPRFIYLQMPIAVRAELGRLGQLPVPSERGTMIPLAELGHFEKFTLDQPIYHKDLRGVEYVTGEVTGRLGAPIYAILDVEKMLDHYIAPDGVRVETNYTGPPADSLKSSLEWTGEWTVTYETFRDMGLAFALALVLIYILVVWEFGNFLMPAIIMVPIPLTLIGIVPGHWLFGASFTATSMIGFIALAGIIVRNSILLVDFARHAVMSGMPVREAVVSSCQARTRPILITALALLAGSSVILSDPIFQGMAISLMFGGLVSTLLTLIVIPLGCVSFRKSLMAGTGYELDPAEGPQGPEDALATARQERGEGGVSSAGVVRAIVSLPLRLIHGLVLAWRVLREMIGLLFMRDGTRAASSAPGNGSTGGPGGGSGSGSGPSAPSGPAPAAPTAPERSQGADATATASAEPAIVDAVFDPSPTEAPAEPAPEAGPKPRSTRAKARPATQTKATAKPKSAEKPKPSTRAKRAAKQAATTRKASAETQATAKAGSAARKTAAPKTATPKTATRKRPARRLALDDLTDALDEAVTEVRKASRKPASGKAAPKGAGDDGAAAPRTPGGDGK